MDDVKTRVIKVLSNVLNKSMETLANVNEFAQIPDWDSLYHLNVILDLEKEFSVKFDIEEVMQVSSVDSAVNLINKRL